MNRYLILIEKALNLKEHIEKLILEGKRKGYIFKTYNFIEKGRFEIVDGLIIETKIIDDKFGIRISTYHLNNGVVVENSYSSFINMTSKTSDIGVVKYIFSSGDIEKIYLCSTKNIIENKIINIDNIEDSITIKAFVKDYKRNYSSYLETSHWENIRNLKLKEAEYKCQLCSKKDVKLHVHHNTYERIGDEDMNDLIVLCEDCHKKFHDID